MNQLLTYTIIAPGFVLAICGCSNESAVKKTNSVSATPSQTKNEAIEVKIKWIDTITWENETLGDGEEGVAILIQRLESCERHSRIMVIDARSTFTKEYTYFEHTYPFDSEADRIFEILIRKRLTFSAPNSPCHYRPVPEDML